MTKGQLGSPPSWWSVIRASRYLGVPPWELMKQPQAWMDWAIEAESAEAAAHKKHQEDAARLQRARQGRHGK